MQKSPKTIIALNRTCRCRHYLTEVQVGEGGAEEEEEEDPEVESALELLRLERGGGRGGHSWSESFSSGSIKPINETNSPQVSEFDRRGRALRG